MYFGGAAWPLCGYDSKYRQRVAPKDAHTCVMLDPGAPWTRGVIQWRAGKGLLDVFSSDGTVQDVPLTVVGGL